MKTKNTQYVSIPEKVILEKIKKNKSNAYYRKGTFTTEIIWGNNSYIINTQPKRKKLAFRKGMFLFGLVRKNARLFLTKKKIKLPKKFRSIEYNNDISIDALENVIGTDLNHAYWRIAYNLNIISVKTYELGLRDEFKSVRLAALSTLGMDKKYNVIKGGEIIDKMHIIKGDEDLRKLYTIIRYTCYKYMAELKKQLGTDFVCYKTDAIYYVNSAENRKIVREFFKNKDLLMKELR